MTIKYFNASWHQNNVEINGIPRVGTQEVFFFFFFLFFCFFFFFLFFGFISHYSFLAAKSKSDSGVSHIRLRKTTNHISNFILSPF